MIDDSFIAAVLYVACPVLLVLSLVPAVVAWVVDGSAVLDTLLEEEADQ